MPTREDYIEATKDALATGMDSTEEFLKFLENKKKAGIRDDIGYDASVIAMRAGVGEIMLRMSFGCCVQGVLTGRFSGW